MMLKHLSLVRCSHSPYETGLVESTSLEAACLSSCLVKPTNIRLPLRLGASGPGKDLADATGVHSGGRKNRALAACRQGKRVISDLLRGLPI